MSLWGKLDRANNAPKFTPLAGSNATGNVMFGNATPGAFSGFSNGVVGLFGVDQTEAGVKGRGVTPGWVIVKTGEGPVTAVVASGGLNVANGETVTLSNGSANGVMTLTSNATGNIASVTINDGGVFPTNTTVVVGFNRQRSLRTITVAGTATGYSNTDTIRVSNGITNATATLVTNSTGGFVTANVTITNIGLFSNTTANNQLVISVLANTGANSAGSGATFTANIAPSTSGSITISTLGGRAGRVQYENIAVIRSMTNAGADAEDTQFPDS
jgi:hypothetical protein